MNENFKDKQAAQSQTSFIHDHLHHNFGMKLKILYLIISAIFAILLSGDNQEYTHIHIELANKFIVEYEKNVIKK